MNAIIKVFKKSATRFLQTAQVQKIAKEGQTLLTTELKANLDVDTSNATRKDQDSLLRRLGFCQESKHGRYERDDPTA